MKFIPLVFVCLKTFYFFRAADICYCLATIKRLAKERRENPTQKHVVIVTQVSLCYIIYMLADILFFFYSIFLVFFTVHKVPGLLLIIFATLERYALHYKITGTYSEDTEHQFVYPNFWLRNFLFLINSYILLKLHISLASL
ncbi:MAG: hypothetical protein Q4D21_06110 [Phascolarctobacterium sp.]|nr:hypothetical protein [Phascolarctobacterium sp.]